MSSQNLSRREFLKGAAASAVGAAVVGLSGCAGVAASAGAARYKPGTYTSTVSGTGKGKVSVSMTFDEKSITDATLDLSGESISVNKFTQDELTKTILHSQSAEVDAVSGPTTTVTAVKKAAQDCIDQALLVPPAGRGQKGLEFEKTEFGTPLWLSPALGMFDWRKKPEAPVKFVASEKADVVIIGAGLAGLCAARRSLEKGHSVIVIENDATYDIHGFAAAAVNPDILRRECKKHGLDYDRYKVDPTEFLRAYMATHNNRTNIDLIRMWTDESGPAFDWYEQIMPEQGDDGNYNYRSVLYFPRPEGYDLSQKEDKYRTFLGTVDFTYQSWAQAGHNLYQTILDKGGKFNYKERAYMLQKDASGRVSGVISMINNADGSLSYKRYEAGKGVIVSTGYHGKAQDIMMEIGVEEAMYTLRNGVEFPASSGFGGSGDGHRMLVWEGADIEPFRQADGTTLSLLDPVAGLALNANGKRFHNEDDQCWTLGLELRWQPGRRQWKIYDANWRKTLVPQNMSHQAIDPINRTPWTVPGTLNNQFAAPYANGTKKKADGTPCDGKEFYLDILEQELLAGVGKAEGISIGNYWSWIGDYRYGAQTLEELAAMMYGEDLEAQKNMLAEIRAYNELCRKGEDTRYGKASNMLFPIEKGPFFAFSAAANGAGRMGQEGIMTNGRLQPVNPSTGKPIPGVYLAGVILGGRHADCYTTPMSGMNHGFDITTGKMAAEYLSEDL